MLAAATSGAATPTTLAHLDSAWQVHGKYSTRRGGGPVVDAVKRSEALRSRRGASSGASRAHGSCTLELYPAPRLYTARPVYCPFPRGRPVKRAARARAWGGQQCDPHACCRPAAGLLQACCRPAAGSLRLGGAGAGSAGSSAGSSAGGSPGSSPGSGAGSGGAHCVRPGCPQPRRHERQQQVKARLRMVTAYVRAHLLAVRRLHHHLHTTTFTPPPSCGCRRSASRRHARVTMLT